MARVTLGRGYWITARRLAPVGSSTAAKVTAELRRLESQWPALPAPGDVEVEAPPVAVYWMRRVPGTALWLYYSIGTEGVTVRALGL